MAIDVSSNSQLTAIVNEAKCEYSFIENSVAGKLSECKER
jgi:hypothetical protein